MSNTIYVNSFKTYIDFLLELPTSNAELHRKQIQMIYEIIQEVDEMALIIKYKPDKGKDKITEKNKVEVGVKAKNIWMNYTEAADLEVFTKWKIK